MTITAPTTNRRAAPGGTALPKDKRRTLKMPVADVQRAGEKARSTDGPRTLASVMTDAVQLFITRKLAPRKIPRGTYGANQNADAATLLLSQVTEELLKEASEAYAELTGWKPPISAIVWTHLVDYADGVAPQPWPAAPVAAGGADPQK